MNEKLQLIIAEVLHVDPEAVTPSSKAEDFEQWDSLAQVLMISRIVDEMGVEIPFDKMMTIEGVQDFIDVIGG